MSRNAAMLQLIGSVWTPCQDTDIVEQDAADAVTWASAVLDRMDTRHALRFTSPFGPVEILGPENAIEYFKKLVTDRLDKDE